MKPHDAQVEELRRLGWYHSIELPGGRVIQGLQSIDQMRLRCAQFPIPEDLRGKRVLDIGAWDGWFSFEMERRGASVVAVDSTENRGFLEAREMLGSKVEYVVEDVCRLSPERLGYFDIVLFLGVLYHLKHPLLGLEKVCELATEMACVESFVTDDGSDRLAPPRLDFYETTELRGQFDNWFGPNVSGLLALCRTAGFARVRFEGVLGNRAHATCYRKWEEYACPEGPAPRLSLIENATSLDFDFSCRRDDYASMWFDAARVDLTVEDVFPRIGGFGSRPVSVRNICAGGWQVNCKLPPGLAPGWHEAALAIGRGGLSNRLRIAVDTQGDAPAPGPELPGLRIESITDGLTWEPDRVRGGAGSWLSLWASGVPAGAGRNDIRVRAGGAEMAPHYLSAPDASGLRQINIPLPAGLKRGRYRLRIAHSAGESPAKDFDLI